MGMSDFYGATDRAESIATIRAALDAGVTLLDTGDFYGSGHNELLIREALAGPPRESVAIAVKFGVQRDPRGGFLGVDNRPAAVKNALAQTLRRLGTDYVDVYQPARVTPDVPIEDTIGALDVSLTPEDLARIERAVPMGAASGSRYDAGQMAMLDSERSGGASTTVHD